MADKSSRSLVLYGDGLARFVDTSRTHIHSLASVASCGFLSLPHAPPGFFSLSLSVSLIRHIVFYWSTLLHVCVTFPTVYYSLRCVYSIVAEETEKERIVREFSQLLDASEAYSIAVRF